MYFTRFFEHPREAKPKSEDSYTNGEEPKWAPRKSVVFYKVFGAEGQKVLYFTRFLERLADKEKFGWLRFKYYRDKGLGFRARV